MKWILSALLLAAAIPRAGFAQAATTMATYYYLYVGTYTGPNSKGIHAFRYDAAQSALQPLGTVAELERPSFLALSPDRRFLYAVSELGNDGKVEGAVYAYAIHPATGKLTFLNRQSSGGGGACHLVVDKLAKTLLVANYGTGSATSFALKPDGSIGDRVSKIQFEGSGPNAERQGGPHAHAVVLSPDNRFLFVPDLGTDHIHILSFDSSSGRLARSADVTVKPGAGPRHFTFSPDGRFAYLICEMGSLVVAYHYNSSTGALTEIQTASTLPNGFTGENNSAEIETDSTGKFLYASNRGHDSIAVFSIDPSTGKLERRQIAPTQGRTPRNFTIDPTQRHLLAANQDSNKIVFFDRDLQTGKLTATGKTVDVPSPVCLLFTPAP
ncbi:MAG TPA: lactonase family protein [Bryobacteraceae bacterium]|jgi:6-phosphogluconolactonase